MPGWNSTSTSTSLSARKSSRRTEPNRASRAMWCRRQNADIASRSIEMRGLIARSMTPLTRRSRRFIPLPIDAWSALRWRAPTRDSSHGDRILLITGSGARDGVVVIGAGSVRADRDQAAEEPLHAAAGRASSVARRPPKSGKQYPIIEDQRITRYLTATRRSARGGGAGGAQAAGLRVFVHAGEPEGDQRLRAAGRADVRSPRHVRGGGRRRRSRRRDGARAVARAAAARHGQRLEGAESLAAARPARRRASAARSSAARPDRPSPRAASSDSARCCCDTAATSRSRRICSARRSWRAPATTRARWPACSRRSSASRRAAAGAARSG